ncbi:MAG: hypothetical protein GWP14_05330 [Actinobacteria bacterium]|nr:hypothetical protein [Actinomycetota bacterium]
MKLPELDNPQRYEGLYVFDFEGQVGVGYTAREIEILLESEKYRDGKVYKIHRAYPNGRLEIKGLSNKVFQVESGMFFHGRDQQQTRKDYQQLLELAQAGEFPCRAKLHLAQNKSPEGTRYVVALIYPAEYDEEVAAWLAEKEYQGGEQASGGASEVAEYYRDYSKIDSFQLWGVLDGTARDANDILANVGRAVVR